MTKKIGKKPHVVVTVKNLKKSKEWYDKIFGFFGYKHAYADDTNVYYRGDNLPFFLAIFQGHDEFQNDTFNRYRVGLHHIGIPVDSKEKVDGFYQHLLKNDVVITEKPQHYPDYGDDLYYAVFFNDPDGLRLEIFYEENEVKN
jgi:catechol 2,3-dioxygenase-like lactoylglutathione lyase family enzyme